MIELDRTGEQVTAAETAAYADLRRSLAPEPTEVIDEPALVRVDGEIAAVQVMLGPVADDVRQALRSIRRFDEGIRTGGMATRSRTFGYHPRLTLKTSEFCGPCALNYEEPDAYAGLLDAATVASDLYRIWRPDLWEAQMERLTALAVLDEYRMVGPFTSGIVNEDNQLPYHRDGGNVTGSWNVMFVVRDRVDGGALHVPGLDVTFGCPDGSAVLLDAGRTTHAVTPLRRRHREAYRLSVVFFALGQMANCLPQAEEIARAQARRTEREERRAGLRT